MRGRMGWKAGGIFTANANKRFSSHFILIQANLNAKELWKEIQFSFSEHYTATIVIKHGISLLAW